MKIYIDVILVENLIMNYIILFATGIVLKVKIKQIRLILGGFLGAIYTVIMYIATIKIYSNLFFKILLSLLIIYISFKPQNIKSICKQLVVFYLISFVFGGAAFALIYIWKPQNVFIKDGGVLEKFSLKTVLMSAVIAFFVIIATFKIIKRKITSKDIYKKIKILIEGKSIELITMVDTGNMLKEPVTGRPVIVVEHTCFFNILPSEILFNIENILAGNLENISETIQNKYITKLRFIPFASLGKQNGMLLGIIPDNVVIIEEDEHRKIDAIIGIYTKSLTKDGKYAALMGINC